ncbi:hypothetical protein BSCA_0917 [Bifidobacterium scardovii]|uniref:Uncharacterized protein n=1 Tax=Bifidobacterium scardovii TaxID=158787 RepID=A0A087DHV0_9BIFI|nr:hypothetical protein BSCA_0917 [Bifidobacterium scardovii]
MFTVAVPISFSEAFVDGFGAIYNMHPVHCPERYTRCLVIDGIGR